MDFNHPSNAQPAPVAGPAPVGEPAPVAKPAPVSERTLRTIVEDGFFGALGTLADARAACAELLFARSIIEAQTLQIAKLHSKATKR